MDWLSKLLRPIVAGGALLFGGLILAFTSWRTFDLFGLVIPAEPLVQILGLVLFDAGLLMWTLLFIHNAEGIGQRAAALAGLGLDLVLVILAVSVDLLIGGQTLVQAGEWAPLLALGVVVVATCGNLTLFLAYHLCAPGTVRAIRERSRADEIEAARVAEEEQVQALALTMFRTKRQAIAAELADGLAEAMLAELQDGLGAHRPNGKAPIVERVPANGVKAPKGKE